MAGGWSVGWWIGWWKRCGGWMMVKISGGDLLGGVYKKSRVVRLGTTNKESGRGSIPKWMGMGTASNPLGNDVKRFEYVLTRHPGFIYDTLISRGQLRPQPKQHRKNLKPCRLTGQPGGIVSNGCTGWTSCQTATIGVGRGKR